MPPRRKPSPPHSKPHSKASANDRSVRDSGDPSSVRIVGGTHRGRKLDYSGDMRVRPMKDRTREAVFNLLGPVVKGSYVLDLFSGTGVVGLESISRGAFGATLLEWHVPTSKLIRSNAERLQMQDRVRIVAGDAFHWGKRPEELMPAEARELPWVIFCCPPYVYFTDRLDAIRDLLETLSDQAPVGSQLVVEAEEPFDFATLWEGDWRVRSYLPAIVGILEIGGHSN